MQEIYSNKGANNTRNELVLFLLDGSGSMRGPVDTSNDSSPSKSAVLEVIVKGLLKRLIDYQLIRIGIIKFTNEPKVEQLNKKSYFTVNEAINILKYSFHDFEENEENEETNISKAFEKAVEIANEFYEDEDMALTKECTLILCTDGKHFEHETDPTKQIEELQSFTNSAESFKVIGISPNVICVSIGTDADIDALIEISTMPDFYKQKRLDGLNLLQYLKKDNSGQYRLCMVGYEKNSNRKYEIETLSMCLFSEIKYDQGNLNNNTYSISHLLNKAKENADKGVFNIKNNINRYYNEDLKNLDGKWNLEQIIGNNTILIITGCHIFIELLDKVSAYKLKDVIDSRGNYRERKRAIIMGDRQFSDDIDLNRSDEIQEKKLINLHLISIGGPASNPITQWLNENKDIIHEFPNFTFAYKHENDILKVAIWGNLAVDTQNAVDEFIINKEKGLNYFLNTIWK